MSVVLAPLAAGLGNSSSTIKTLDHVTYSSTLVIIPVLGSP